NTITLAAGHTFTLTAVDNNTPDATGLPVIAANDNLTIVGNGDTIARGTAAGTPAFRLFHVAGRAALTLQNLTLANGHAVFDGGGIENDCGGTLALANCTLAGNAAGANGGGIENDLGGTLALANCTLAGNTALFGGGGIENLEEGTAAL